MRHAGARHRRLGRAPAVRRAVRAAQVGLHGDAGLRQVLAVRPGGVRPHARPAHRRARRGHERGGYGARHGLQVRAARRGRELRPLDHEDVQEGRRAAQGMGRRAAVRQLQDHRGDGRRGLHGQGQGARRQAHDLLHAPGHVGREEPLGASRRGAAGLRGNSAARAEPRDRPARARPRPAGAAHAAAQAKPAPQAQGDAPGQPSPRRRGCPRSGRPPAS